MQQMPLLPQRWWQQGATFPAWKGQKEPKGPALPTSMDDEHGSTPQHERMVQNNSRLKRGINNLSVGKAMQTITPGDVPNERDSDGRERMST